MKLKWSLYLGQIAGTKLYIHWSFFILIGWIFFQYFNAGGWYMGGMGVLFILSLFACVTLHEFGHVLVAKRYGVPTRSITLLPIGGLAQLESLPEKPWQEFQVAIAGPMVNVVIAILLFIYLKVSGTMPEWGAKEVAGSFNYFFNLFLANISLAVFNLIPAFPMDGGRILRALLSLRRDRDKATRIAARIGQFLAVGFMIIGIFSNVWLIAIGVFIFIGAEGEARLEKSKKTLSGTHVRDAIMTQYTMVSPDDTLATAVEHLLKGQERGFLVGKGDQTLGVISRSDIIKGLVAHGMKGVVTDVMHRDFPAINPDMLLQDVYLKVMTTQDAICPVYDGAKLIGVIDSENISELLLIRDALSLHGDH
jgi:Zn-dependent protease